MSSLSLVQVIHLLTHTGWIKPYYPFTSEELLSLATVNKAIFSSVSIVICSSWFFLWNRQCEFRFHSPKKLTFTSSIKGDLSSIVSNSIPKSVNHLKILGTKVWNSLHLVPATITSLTFGTFNLRVDNLPDSIIELRLGRYFDKSVDHLPPNLQVLIIDSTYFSHALDHLPQSLKHLHLLSDSEYSGAYDNLPSSLESFKCPVNTQYLDHLPSTLKKLDATFHITKSPRSRYEYSSKKLSYWGEHFQIDHLPSNLTTLILGGKFNYTVDYLPQNITDLHFWGEFDKPIDYLPNKLLSLRLEGQFNQPIDHLPQNLVSLQIRGRFKQPTDNLPPSLKKLQSNWLYPLRWEKEL